MSTLDAAAQIFRAILTLASLAFTLALAAVLFYALYKGGLGISMLLVYFILSLFMPRGV